jgi:hypothetical protein
MYEMRPFSLLGDYLAIGVSGHTYIWSQTHRHKPLDLHFKLRLQGSNFDIQTETIKPQNLDKDKHTLKHVNTQDNRPSNK